MKIPIKNIKRAKVKRSSCKIGTVIFIDGKYHVRYKGKLYPVNSKYLRLKSGFVYPTDLNDKTDEPRELTVANKTIDQLNIISKYWSMYTTGLKVSFDILDDGTCAIIKRQKHGT